MAYQITLDWNAIQERNIDPFSPVDSDNHNKLLKILGSNKAYIRGFDISYERDSVNNKMIAHFTGGVGVVSYIVIEMLQNSTIELFSCPITERTIHVVLDYKYQKEEYYYKSNKSWWNPFSWFEDDSKVVTQEALHILTIKPLDLKQSIERSMNNTIESFVEQEKTNYENAIIGVIKDNSIIFNDFRNNKKKEINDLNNKLKNSEKELQLVEKQLEDFNNLTKE